MPKVLGWRAWFDSGWDFNSKDSRWEELPDDGVLVRVIYFSDGTREFQAGFDYYYEAGHPTGVIYGGGFERDDIPNRYIGAVIKKGRWAPDGFFRMVAEAAMKSKWD